MEIFLPLSTAETSKSIFANIAQPLNIDSPKIVEKLKRCLGMRLSRSTGQTVFLFAKTMVTDMKAFAWHVRSTYALLVVSNSCIIKTKTIQWDLWSIFFWRRDNAMLASRSSRGKDSTRYIKLLMKSRKSWFETIKELSKRSWPSMKEQCKICRKSTNKRWFWFKLISSSFKWNWKGSIGISPLSKLKKKGLNQSITSNYRPGTFSSTQIRRRNEAHQINWIR